MNHDNIKTFSFINNQKLCAIIESASQYIIYAAPSIAESVAQSLCKFAESNENAVLRVIVDADAEAFRLGFGEQAGLALLANKHIDTRRAEGLRIAVLIADENAWVYSPTPEIIFEQPTAAINNAIQVSAGFGEQIILSIAPDLRLKSADEALSESTVKDLKPEIGAENLTTEDLTRLEQQLKDNPPQKFDAARKVRVYQGYFQFVELHLTGCQLNRHTINIPQILLNLAEDNEMRERVRSTCKLVDNTSEFSRKVKGIEKQVAEVRKQFTRPLGKNYGVVILKRMREDFEKEIEKIRAKLTELSESVQSELETEIDKSRMALVGMLLPSIISNPPKVLTAQLFGELTEETATQFIINELNKVIPETESLIGEMKLDCYYKDVTFESLNDTDFINAIEEKYPYNNFAKLYSEQDAIGQK